MHNLWQQYQAMIGSPLAVERWLKYITIILLAQAVVLVYNVLLRCILASTPAATFFFSCGLISALNLSTECKESDCNGYLVAIYLCGWITFYNPVDSTLCTWKQKKIPFFLSRAFVVVYLFAMRTFALDIFDFHIPYVIRKSEASHVHVGQIQICWSMIFWRAFICAKCVCEM